LRKVAILGVFVLPLLAMPALAQDYLLPDGPGKAELTGACGTCHGILTVTGQKRSPRQWDAILQQMTALGAKVDEAQGKAILAYLNSHYGQEADYVPRPPPPKARGPGLVLALEAAETAAENCRAKGYRVTTLVVDSAGNVVVQLAGDGASPITGAIAATKTATVLKYKVASGVVMKRMDSDPALVAEIKADPKIGEVRQGGLPLVADGVIVGAIAVSGDVGPVDKDEICAQAGIDRIAARLK
jgi:uncharacterized protein GlcG (DUF336 family)